MRKKDINKPAMSKPHNILVILPNNLGDIIMTTPALEGLKSKHPDSQVTFFAEEGFEGSIINNPHIDSIFLFGRRLIRDSFRKGEWKAGSREFIGVTDRLRNNEFDLLINLSQHSYTSNLVLLINAKSVVGCHFLREGNYSLAGEWTQYLYAIPFARRYNLLHVSDVYRRMAGVNSHIGGYTIRITDSEKKEAGEYLLSIGVDITSRKIIVFQPGAAFSAKRWPAEHFVRLGRMLMQKGWQVIISGAPAEKEPAVNIQTAIGENCCISAGDTNFRRAVANLSFVQACVTGDTALMHAASALGVKTYALFGATSPLETGPYGEGHFVFSGACAEKPCFCDTCKSMLCMKSILPETVFSCIENGTVPDRPKCDIYKTSVKQNDDYALIPAVPDALSYYSTAGALLAKRAFEDNCFSGDFSPEDMDTCIKESQQFIKIVARMERNLNAFLENRSIELVRDFEKGKDELSILSGIGCFWSALLNLKLNSIQMLDVIEGARASAEVCSGIIKQIQKAISCN